MEHNTNTLPRAAVLKGYLDEMMIMGGLTLDQIAQSCFISKRTLKNVITNKVSHISPKFFGKILHYYCALMCRKSHH